MSLEMQWSEVFDSLSGMRIYGQCDAEEDVVPLDNVKLTKAVNTTEKLVKRMDALEARRKDDYGHPVKANNRVQQTEYGIEAENKLNLDAKRGQEDA